MSVAATLGPRSLIQLGISLTDIAQIYKIGKKIGNWIMIRSNDQDLFETLLEDPEALLKRKGLIEPARMESMFPHAKFIYDGDKQDSSKKDVKIEHGELRPFSWLMVVIVRGIYTESLAAFRKVWKDKVGVDAYPELNPAEKNEMAEFLLCLMGNTSVSFTCFSLATYSVARALEKCKVFISTKEKRSFEGQLLVTYVSDRPHTAHGDGPCCMRLRATESRAQIVSFPLDNPMSMVQATRAERHITNQMESFWDTGARAAKDITFVCTAEYPYSTKNEVQYSLGEFSNACALRFDPYLMAMAGKAFPLINQSILKGLEDLVKGYDGIAKAWLETHAGLEYLLKSQTESPDGDQKLMGLWLCYQAFVFGFYYRLLEPLTSHELVSNTPAYFCGLWGHGSTTFLAMCSQFGKELKTNNKVGRTHVLYMLATMYAGRNKTFLPDSSRINLVGVLGSTSILTRTLLRPSDNPEDLGKFFLLDLPAIHLAPNEEGELYAAAGHGLEYRLCEARRRDVEATGPSEKWTVYSSMSTAFREGNHGVVMAARCGERLVGCFSPAAADAIFLSEAYCHRRHENDEEINLMASSVSFEISDKDWQDGCVKRVGGDEDETFGLVHSRGCPPMRYATAGFYGEIGEELAISTDDIDIAIGRVQLANCGIVIA
ncbi:hypothetical protein FPSE_03421 [Fusarium pseudograminearum CS3096]|uniref:Uncharacterized protein n=1 Tax=Fusarium pseudograminearum (strain CS3096) TaxID=1028729 RepID=K3VMW1_FUSPC|nr:hypothetical protein FPSE_03421 [Fusarium pseudograminearum CS3096]EKJ76422.1 hypothetical protein FPSE_03421 [Fusarium pseudograminearum CS3096]